MTPIDFEVTRSKIKVRGAYMFYDISCPYMLHSCIYLYELYLPDQLGIQWSKTHQRLKVQVTIPRAYVQTLEWPTYLRMIYIFQNDLLFSERPTYFRMTYIFQDDLHNMKNDLRMTFLFENDLCFSEWPTYLRMTYIF